MSDISAMTETGEIIDHKLQILVLERRNASRNMARFYVLAIEPTLYIGVKSHISCPDQRQAFMPDTRKGRRFRGKSRPLDNTKRCERWLAPKSVEKLPHKR